MSIAFDPLTMLEGSSSSRYDWVSFYRTSTVADANLVYFSYNGTSYSKFTGCASASGSGFGWCPDSFSVLPFPGVGAAPPMVVPNPVWVLFSADALVTSWGFKISIVNGTRPWSSNCSGACASAAPVAYCGVGATSSAGHRCPPGTSSAFDNAASCDDSAGGWNTLSLLYLFLGMVLLLAVAFIMFRASIKRPTARVVTPVRHQASSAPPAARTAASPQRIQVAPRAAAPSAAVGGNNNNTNNNKYDDDTNNNANINQAIDIHSVKNEEEGHSDL